jgi:hypothetical protein
MSTKANSAAPEAQDFTVLIESKGMIAEEYPPIPAGQIPEDFMQAARDAFKANTGRRERFFNQPVVSIVKLSKASPIPYVTVSLPL